MKPLIGKYVLAFAAGLTCLAAKAFVVGPAGATAVNTVLPAIALTQNSRGIGHILIVPYYTAQNGNDTYLNIVNTDMRNGKALKIRFRGASNSDDVKDFTLYLSPGDVWAAAITKPAGSDLPILVTPDKSCTQPPIPSEGTPFSTVRLHPNLTDAQKASETREGYVEIFNMADIPPNAGGAGTDTLYEAIEHVNGIPRDCNHATLANLLAAPLNTAYGPALAGAPNGPGDTGHLGLEVPTTGVMVNWSIVNVPSASSWSGSGLAIEALVATDGGAPGYGNIVFHPQVDSSTGLNAAGGLSPSISERTADPLLRGGSATNASGETPTLPAPIAFSSFDLPDLSTPYLRVDLVSLANGVATKRQASRLTEAIVAASVSNEYVTTPGLSAVTDWTFSMPMRRYNVARQYTNGADESSGNTVFSNLRADDGGTLMPTRNFFSSNGNQIVSNTIAGKRHQICVTGISFVGGGKGAAAGAEPANRNSGVTADREERFVSQSSGGAVFSPVVAGTPASFCGEVSVLVFNGLGQPSALGSEVARREITTEQPEGWVRFATPGFGDLGLPIIGYSFIQLTNNNAAPGVRGNYGIAFKHRSVSPLVP